MSFRLAVVFLALYLAACGSSGGDSAPPAPQPQWGRARADDANSGLSPTGFTNLGFPCVATRLSQLPIRTTPAIGNDGTVFVMTEDNGLFALDADGVTPQWNFPTVNNPIWGPLGVSHSSVAVDGFNNTFFGTEDGHVVGLGSDGEPLWQPIQIMPATAISGSPLLVIDPVENLVQAFFIGTADGRILAIGGQDGQIRWQFETAPRGAVNGSVIFDGFTLYASSANGFMYFLNQRGVTAFPKVALGDVGDPAMFTASPNLFGQVLGQSGLVGDLPGRVRGVAANGLELWNTEFDAPVSTSLTQFSRVLDQRITFTNGGVSEGQVTVTDFVAVDDEGSGWFVDPALGSRGKRCIGGQNDLQACRSSDDCATTIIGTPTATPVSTPQVTPTPTFQPACLPPYACVGGSNAGESCRPDTGTADCASTSPTPAGECLPITKCRGGANDGQPCNENDLPCPDGVCDLAIFHVNEPIVAAPIAAVDGTIYVATASEELGGRLYAIEPPSTKEPLESTCSQTVDNPPEFCRFAFTATVGTIIASPAITTSGILYFGDDRGYFYTITGSESLAGSGSQCAIPTAGPASPTATTTPTP